MIEPGGEYVSPQSREQRDENEKSPVMYLNPWNVQRIVYELIANHFLMNDPAALGYKFTQRYSRNNTESQIYLDVAYRWDANQVNKRPAVFVSREDEAILPAPFIGQNFATNPQESTAERYLTCYLPIRISCIGTNLGITEELASYVKHPLLYYGLEIKQDFRFRGFQFKGTTRPSLYVEAKDHFLVEMQVMITYDENWVVRRDDLKLKTISCRIFDEVTSFIHPAG